jgi:ABC-type Na+ efflux pump permease subunit
MKKKWIILLIVIILVFALAIYLYINSFKEDKKETLKIMKQVNTDYPVFIKATNACVEKRNEFYKQKEDIYLEEISKNPADWTTLMSEYEELLNQVETSSKRLKKYCKNEFGDITVKTECNKFKANYEAVMNYYITDVKVYNKLVKEYNEWVNTNNSSASKLEKVKLKIYDKYIDFDEDGEYFGKEVVK